MFETRVYHAAWILDEARVELESSTMLSALGLPEPVGAPLVHFGKSQEVEVWAPAAVGAGAAAGDGERVERSIGH